MKALNKKGVSIIISAYNAQDFIEECLDSINNQTYFKNFDEWEVLVGIDGCHDTFEVIKKIQLKYKNLRIFWIEENSGPYLVSNTLILNSKYDIISVFNADDIMLDNYLEENIKNLREDNFVLAKCSNFIHPDKYNIIRTYNPDGTITFNKHHFINVNGYANWRCGADTDIINVFINANLKRHNNNTSTMLRRIHDKSLTSEHNVILGKGTDYRNNILTTVEYRKSNKIQNLEYSFYEKAEEYQPKININSYNCEFGYELISVLPFAYWLHTKGLLNSTCSGNDTSSLYYFSKNHTINHELRDYKNCYSVYNDNIPNAFIHVDYLDFSKFKIPPYKEIFANSELKWEKPTLCICNRYNREWNHEPINYFDLECLKHLFETLQDKYQIVYFATSIPEELQDHAHSIDLGDYEFAKQYPKVIIFQDLVKDSWNETMLKVFANCEKFITMNGGYTILASFFGGQNIIYSKMGKVESRELKNGSFWRWYPEFANSQIIYVDSYDELYKNLVKFEIPTVNILIRTHHRPNYFADCIKSIKNQTYQNINVILGVEDDDKETINYAYKYPYRVVHYPKIASPPAPTGAEYGVDFPYNQYLNILTQKCPTGYIMHLDDDDMFTSNTAIEEMVHAIKNHDLLYWKVDCKVRIVPNDEHWEQMTKGMPPTVCDVSSIGFAYSTKFKNIVDWGYWKRGDFRVANTLHQHCKSICLNKVLTAVQDKQHGGKSDDKISSEPLKKPNRNFTNFWFQKKQLINSH
jgi:glycosyltransferase involved in cell wall biosynthesis